MKRMVLACLVAASACSSGGFSEDVRENFLAACHLSSSGNDESCECILSEIEDRMSEEEYRELEGEGQSAVLGDERIAGAVEACN